MTKRRRCTYLRIVATTRCNLSCKYCHMEGDPQTRGTLRELPSDVLCACLDAATRVGIRKFKFLGGEPFARADLPEVIADLRRRTPAADLSAITAGVVTVDRLHAAYSAGLSRVNVSVHGFSPSALARYTCAPRAHAMRTAFLEAVLAAGRPVKVNYVYRSTFDAADLGDLLAWAAPRGLLVNVLDDLSREISWEDVAAVVRLERGQPQRLERVEDPDSLSTVHWHYADGLRVEIKDQRLGELALYASCAACPVRRHCREGIHALRLTHDGHLQPCLNRPDLRLPIAQIVRRQGAAAAAEAWDHFLETL